MYMSRSTPLSLHTSQLEIDNGQDGRAGGPIRVQLLVVVITFTLGFALELINPGTLAYMTVLQ